jgi:glyoxylase-like metal-dependent hydrolase (beta-lactamase superfamily II)
MSVGRVEVSLVRESEEEVAFEELYDEFDPAVLEANSDWLAPYLTAGGQARMSMHSLVLRSEDRVIVVDTCVGTRPLPDVPSLDNRPSNYLEELAAAGIALEDVDVVACTHLHHDHVGWNTRLLGGRWVPTFPNAEYLLIREEFDHWASGAAGAAITFTDAVLPVFEAGLSRFVTTTHAITSEVSLVPSAGHSPGHVGVHISSEGHEALLTGDALHHPVQFVAPEWRMRFDSDPDAGVATRRAMMEQYADTGTLIFGAHFAGSGSGLIVRDGSAYRLV